MSAYYTTNDAAWVKRASDGALIPVDEQTQDSIAYQQWKEAGNVAVAEELTLEEKLDAVAEKYAEKRTILQENILYALAMDADLTAFRAQFTALGVAEDNEVMELLAQE